jgi:acyl-CoA thioesterase-1
MRVSAFTKESLRIGRGWDGGVRYGRKLVAFQSMLQKWVSRTVLAVACAVLLVQGPAAYAAASAPIRILAFGDSLSAGYGLADVSEAFPAQLEKALKAKGHNVVLVASAISGETTSGARSRLEWSMAEKPDAVIVEFGGNDALRAVDPKITADNLDFIVRRIQKDGTPVLIAGMLAPPNLGRDYEGRFNAVFPKLAKDTGALFYPFFLDGAITVEGMMQGDRIHPNPKGVQEIVKRMLPLAEKLVAEVQARRAAAAK